MNKKLKVCLEVVLIAVLTFIVTLSSPFNLWITNSFTDVQNEILDIAYLETKNMEKEDKENKLLYGHIV